MKHLQPNLRTSRRVFTRFTPAIGLSINTKDTGESGERNATALDMSRGGVSFVSESRFKKNDFVLLYFSGEKDFAIVGQVVWVKRKNKKFHYGVAFQFFNDPFSRQQQRLLELELRSYDFSFDIAN